MRDTRGIDLERLGRRLRTVRTRQRLTLKDVEAASGFSATHVSEIERGRTSPTIGALVRIAAALGCDPNYFIEERELEPVAHSREAPFTTSTGSGSQLRPLTSPVLGARFQSFDLTIPTGEHIRVTADTGEAFGRVRAGEVRLCLPDGERRVVKGEAFHYLLRGDHTLENAGVVAAGVTLILPRSAVRR